MAKRVGDNQPPPIIVKKVTVVSGGHHGGAWKVAYADFVTAMMAFFLLLWLLGSTTETQRKGLADYFTPTLVKTRNESSGSDGLLGGSSLTAEGHFPRDGGDASARAMTLPGGPADNARQLKRMQERMVGQLRNGDRTRRLMRQVRMVETTEGVRIDLVDDADFSMFLIGTTVLTPDAIALLHALAEAVGPERGELTIRGHTDALPWKAGASVNNWSLSAGRAEATRQELIRNGIRDPRFRRIEGVADREPLIADDPMDARNRRISILLTR